MAVSRVNPQMFWSRHDWALTIQHEMADYREEVGRRLRELRVSRSLSQEDAAHLVGVRVKTWGLWERGASAPYERSWQKIQAGFQLSDDAISVLRGKGSASVAVDGQLTEGEKQILRAIDDVIARLERLEAAERPPGEAA